MAPACRSGEAGSSSLVQIQPTPLDGSSFQAEICSLREPIHVWRMIMSRRLDPEEVISAALTGTFLLGFVLLFAWLLLSVWTDLKHLPGFTKTETFTNITTSMVGLVGGIAAARMSTHARRGHGFKKAFGWIYVT